MTTIQSTEQTTEKSPIDPVERFHEEGKYRIDERQRAPREASKRELVRKADAVRVEFREPSTEINLDRGTAEYDARLAQQWADEQVSTLTTEQRLVFAVIEAEEVSERQQKAMNAAIDCCSYTTTALVAMAAWLNEMGDCKGAGMVLAFAGNFARHEAVTL